MKKYNKAVGYFGEAAAEKHLKKNKYKILDNNYSIRGGEIDIIAEKDGYVVFVEVKTRSGEKFGTGAEAVTYNKKQRLTKAAQVYLLYKPETNARFDVIEVFVSVDGEKMKVVGITHIENAF